MSKSVNRKLYLKCQSYSVNRSHIQWKFKKALRRFYFARDDYFAGQYCVIKMQTSIKETLYIHLILDVYKTKFKTCSEISIIIKRCAMFLIKLFVMYTRF